MDRIIAGPIRLSKLGSLMTKKGVGKGEVKRTGIEYNPLKIPREIKGVREKIRERLLDTGNSKTIKNNQNLG